MLIRPETAADHEAIRNVNRLAFGQDAEARLVDGPTEWRIRSPVAGR